MLITSKELRYIIKEQLSSSAAGEMAQFKSRESSMLSRWQEEGVDDTLAFEAWMTALVTELQDAIDSDDVLDRYFGWFLDMPSDDKKTWESLSSSFGDIDNYYDLWLASKGSLGAISNIVHVDLIQSMRGEAAEAVATMYGY